jgi:excisionase family DNA binding protein
MARELLTTAEVAEMLRVSRSTVTRYARLGQLPVIRLPSGYLRFRREDIERLLAQGDDDRTNR